MSFRCEDDIILRDVTTWLLLLLHDVLFFIYVMCLCSEFSILDRRIFFSNFFFLNPYNADERLS